MNGSEIHPLLFVAIFAACSLPLLWPRRNRRRRVSWLYADHRKKADR